MDPVARNLLDVHASAIGQDDAHSAARGIEQEADVGLVRRPDLLLDAHRPDEAAADCRAEHGLELGGDFLPRLRFLDEADLAAATGGDLALDHPWARRQYVAVNRVVAADQASVRHGDAVLREQLLGVVLQ